MAGLYTYSLQKFRQGLTGDAGANARPRHRAHRAQLAPRRARIRSSTARAHPPSSLCPGPKRSASTKPSPCPFSLLLLPLLLVLADFLLTKEHMLAKKSRSRARKQTDYKRSITRSHTRLAHGRASSVTPIVRSNRSSPRPTCGPHTATPREARARFPPRRQIRALLFSARPHAPDASSPPTTQTRARLSRFSASATRCSPLLSTKATTPIVGRRAQSFPRKTIPIRIPRVVSHETLAVKPSM